MYNKYILHINCSPRLENSSSNLLGAWFIEGLLQNESFKDCEVKHVFLKTSNILECEGCLKCFYGKECPLSGKDSFEDIYKLQEKASIVVWSIPHAGPFGYPASLTRFLERASSKAIKGNNIVFNTYGGFPGTVSTLYHLKDTFRRNIECKGYFIIPQAPLLYRDEYQEAITIFKEKIISLGCLFFNGENSNKKNLIFDIEKGIISNESYLKLLKELKI